MPVTKTLRIPKQAETDIAVLQVKVENIEKDVSEIKQDIRDVHDAQAQKHHETQEMIRAMEVSSASAHKSLSDKINALEKWRWMMMGAGVALGALGHNVLGNLLK